MRERKKAVDIRRIRDVLIEERKKGGVGRLSIMLRRLKTSDW